MSSVNMCKPFNVKRKAKMCRYHICNKHFHELSAIMHNKCFHELNLIRLQTILQKLS